MSLLKRFLDALNPPVHLIMTPSDGGVQVDVRQNGQTVDLAATRQASELPPAVLSAFERAARRRNGAYLFPFEVARNLALYFRANSDDGFILEPGAILTLREIAMPAWFGIHWLLDSKTWRMRRHLHGADHALGGGWFAQQNQVWHVPPNSIPPQLLYLLDLSELNSSDGVHLVMELLPVAEANHLPFSADAVVAPPGKLRVEIVKMLERSMDIRLIGNPPALLNMLQPVPNVTQHLMSGNLLFPHLGIIPTALLGNLKKGDSVRITGEDVPALVNDVLRPNAAELGIDLAKLDAQYPILELSKMKPWWRLDHTIARGVGRYEAALHFTKGQESLARETVRAKMRGTSRFVKANRGWIALSYSVIKRLDEIDARLGDDFVLDGGELLGNPSPRLTERQIAVPPLGTPTPSDNGEQIIGWLDTVRAHGLPAGIAGFSDFGFTVLTAACQHLLTDYDAARILWVAPMIRQRMIQPALEKAFRVRTANRTGNYDQTGTIYLCEAFHPGLSYGMWTAVVFENVDAVLPTPDVARWGALSRDWTLFASMTLPNTWRQDRAHHLMHLLRMNPADYEAFARHCIWEAATLNQPVRFGEKFTTSFKKFIVGEDKPGAPVPQRLVPRASSPSSPVLPPNLPPNLPPSVPPESLTPPKRSTREVFTPQFDTPPITYVDYPDSRDTAAAFVAQARKWADRTQAQAEPVLFMKQRPSYAEMTPDQLRWYFYWRTQARAGKWLPTDLSYLLVYAYEIINQIGFDTPQAALDQLIRLRDQYKQLQPRLDDYLNVWIVDMSAMFKLTPTPLQLLLQTEVPDMSVMFEAWRQNRVESGASIETMPLDMLYMLAAYAPNSSKFYQQMNKKGEIDTAFRKSVAAIDSHLRQTTGKGLFDLPPSGQPRVLRREPFATVPHAYPRTPQVIAEISVNPQADSVLAANLEAILKHTENILRARANFKGRLRGFELPDGWAAVIEKAQTVRAPRRRVALDQAQLKRLAAESSDVRAMLSVPDAAPAAPPLSIPEEGFLTTAKAQNDPMPARPATTPADALTNLEPVYQVMGGAGDPSARTLLGLLCKSGWRATPDALQDALGATFLSTVVDRINERALEIIGDNLLFEEGGAWVLADDYCDEVEYLVKNSYESAAAPGSTPPPAPAQPAKSAKPAQPDYAALPGDLAALARALQPAHWRILQAFADFINIAEVLQKEAIAAHTLPNVLIEAINERALETTGDLIIDTMEEPPALLEDAAESIRRLLTWAEGQPALVK